MSSATEMPVCVSMESGGSAVSPLRIAVVLPGLHRVNRGAETAFECLSRELALRPDCRVTLFGAGRPRAGEPYRFVTVPASPRERFERLPSLPALRSETAWEELIFAASLLRRYDPVDFDVTLGCSYPWCNWLLRARRRSGRRPAHVFVTENGDWAPLARNREFRLFRCDGLVCTNPVYYERNRERWNTVLIPNGVDPDVFGPGGGDRPRFGLPADRRVVLMVSALIPSKRVLEGIEAVSRVEDVHLVVAGDGPLRRDVEETGRAKLPGRFTRLSIPRERMPDLYRSADVFLHMSLDEPSANAYIEALATGLPIVTQDRDVTRWTLEDCGTLVDTTRPEAVAKALPEAAAAGGPEWTGRRRELVARRFTWRGIAASYSQFLADVVLSPSFRIGSAGRVPYRRKGEQRADVTSPEG